eukprot:COSAG06_NODE_7094_length_2637_cov_2.378251_2_plen_81_part_00
MHNGQAEAKKHQWKKMQGLVAMGAAHLPPGFSYARRLTWTKAAGLVDIKGDGGTVALKNGAKSERTKLRDRLRIIGSGHH